MIRVKAKHAGQQKRAKAAARSARLSAAAREIAPCPPCADPDLRDRCLADLRTFLETCFPQTFRLAWSEDHLKAIRRLQHVIVYGGQYALAMFRGGGKTSIMIRAALWAVLRGARRFPVVVAATAKLADDNLSAIKTELETNQRLLELFPEAVYPFRCLAGESRRCGGQTYQGKRTRIAWRRNEIVFATLPEPDAKANGAIIYSAGLTGAIRGLSRLDGAGRTIRPDLLLVDDPQDRASAASALQTAERLALLNGDLLGLAGPGQRIAALAALTVIYRRDLTSQLLDAEKSPSWEGQRFKLIYTFPTAATLWEKYHEIRDEGRRPGRDREAGERAATDFYREHQAEMDAGSAPAWPAYFEPSHEISATQHVMNLKHDQPTAFAAEYQNEPLDETPETQALDPVAIVARCGGYHRAEAPADVERVTAFIDVGGALLWYLVAGWTQRFDAYILDYGAFPQQRARIFAAAKASPTLAEVYPAGDAEAAVFAGLRDLLAKLFAPEAWKRTDGAILPVSRCLIDAGWETNLVRKAIWQSPYRAALCPSKGIGLGPTQRPISEYERKPGEYIGDGWIVGAAGPDRLRLLRFDTNLWKTRLAGMLTRPVGMAQSVSLFGERHDHELLAMHLCSEYPTRVEATATGNTVNVWSRKPNADNHLFDCLIGAAVAASTCGCGQAVPIPRPRPPRRRGPAVSYLNL